MPGTCARTSKSKAHFQKHTAACGDTGPHEGRLAAALTSTEKSPAAWPAATFLALSSKNAVVAALAWAASSASWNACDHSSHGAVYQDLVTGLQDFKHVPA